MKQRCRCAECGCELKNVPPFLRDLTMCLCPPHYGYRWYDRPGGGKLWQGGYTRDGDAEPMPVEAG